MLKSIRLLAKITTIALALSATGAHGIELIKYGAEPEILADPYRQTGVSVLDGSLIGIRTGTSTTSAMTIFDASNGDIVAGDVFDTESPRIIEYSAQTGWAVAVDSSGTLELVKPNDPNASSMEIEPGRSILLVQFVGPNRDHLLVISRETESGPRTIRATNLSTLETAWEKQFEGLPTLILSPNRGRLIVVKYEEDGFTVKTLETFDTVSGSLYQTADLSDLELIGTNSLVNTLYYSPSGQITFIYRYFAQRLIVLDNDTGTYADHTFGAPTLLTSNEDFYIAYNSSNELEVRSTGTGDILYNLPADTEGTPAFSGAGDSIFFRQTGSTTIQEVDFSTGATLNTFEAPESFEGIQKIFTNGSTLAATATNDKLMVYDLQTDETNTIDLPFETPSAGGFTVDGNSIVIPHESGQIISVLVSDPTSYLQLTKGHVEIVKYSETNDNFLVLRGTGKIHQLAPETLDSTLAATIPLQSSESIIDVSADTLRTIIKHSTGDFAVFDPSTESVLYESDLTLSTDSLYRGAISPDGRYLAYSFVREVSEVSTTHLVIYDLESDAVVAEIDSNTLDVDVIIFSPDNTTLYAAGINAVYAIDLSDGSTSTTIGSLPENFIFNVSQDSQYLAVIAPDLLKVVATSTGAIYRNINLATDSAAAPTAVALSHDNAMALVISGDNLATLVDLTSEETLDETQVFWAQSNNYNTSATAAPVFFPDSRSYINYTKTGSAIVWSFEVAHLLPSSITIGTTAATVNFASVEGLVHIIESSTDLEIWEIIQTLDPESETIPDEVEISVPLPAESSFFRVWTYD